MVALLLGGFFCPLHKAGAVAHGIGHFLGTHKTQRLIALTYRGIARQIPRLCFAEQHAAHGVLYGVVAVIRTVRLGIHHHKIGVGILILQRVHDLRHGIPAADHDLGAGIRRLYQGSLQILCRSRCRRRIFGYIAKVIRKGRNSLPKGSIGTRFHTLGTGDQGDRRTAGQRFCVLRRRKGIFGVVRGGCCLRLVRLLLGRLASAQTHQQGSCTQPCQEFFHKLW